MQKSKRKKKNIQYIFKYSTHINNGSLMPALYIQYNSPLCLQQFRCRELMMTAMFIITSNNKMPQSLNLRHSCLPLHRSWQCQSDCLQLTQFTQGGSKVRRPCQSTIVGSVCTELRHSDRNLYHYRMDVYTHFQHTFMFKQLEVNFASDDPFNKCCHSVMFIILMFQHVTIIIWLELR